MNDAARPVNGHLQPATGMDAAALAQAAVEAMEYDWVRTAELAARLRRDYPFVSAGYHYGLAAARKLERADEIPAILGDAVLNLGREEWVLAEAMWDAIVRGAIDIAQKRARDLRTEFPDNVASYQHGLRLARQTQNFDEVAEILAAALRRFPDQEWVLAECSAAAMERADMEEAACLSARFRAGFPHNALGYQIGCRVAHDMLQFDLAATILAQARAHLPAESWMLFHSALINRAMGDLAAALENTLAMRRDFPDEAGGYDLGIHFLRQAGLLNEARCVVNEALQRFPNETWPQDHAKALEQTRADRADAEVLINHLRDVTLELSAPQPADKKVVVVLGMHRAGTSLCTRIVHALGIDLGGPLVQPNFQNPEGFHEHREIVDCHQALLGSLGRGLEASWLRHGVPHGFWDTDEVAGISARLETIVGEQLAASGGTWAFKDPRTAHFLPLWQRVFAKLGIEPIWVVSVRHPSAVARSTLARDGTPAALGELLWVEHYLDIFRHVGSQIGAICHYERWFSDAASQICALADLIGCSGVDVETATQVIKPNLRHEVARETDDYVLPATRLLYHRLLNASPNLGLLQTEAAALWRQLRRGCEVTAA